MTANAKPESVAKAQEIIAVLKQHPDGVPRNKLARAVRLKSDMLNTYLDGLLKYEPIAYDERISNIVYWIGV